MVSPNVGTEGFADGSTQGLWNKNGVLTQNGSAHFNEITPAGLRPKQPLTRSVTEVTGITDVTSQLGGAPAGAKEVQFRWDYGGFNEVTKRFIVRGGTGVAIARLFDDGWRLAEIRLQELGDGFVLSPEERAAADKDRDTETQRRLAEERLVAQARQASAVISKCGPIAGFSFFTDSDSFSVTDAGVSGAYHANIAYIDVQYFLKIDPNPTEFDSRPGIWLSDHPWNPGGDIGIRFTGPQRAANRDTCYKDILQAYDRWRTRFPTLAKLPPSR